MFLYYKEIVAKYLEERIQPELDRLYGSNEDFIVDYEKVWDKFTNYSFILNKLFNYIDRYYLSQNKDSKIHSLFSTARELFKNIIFDNCVDRLK